jgi:hypothetical protein
MKQMSSNMQPLFAGDPERLAAKLNSATGLLGRYWHDFQTQMLTQPGARSNLIFLPALLSGEGLKEARDAIKSNWQGGLRNDASVTAQFHTWCASGIAMRRAVYFDWLACRNAWSKAEIREAGEAFLGFAFKHSYMVLTSRSRTSNNQALVMALNCAVTGYLFGCRHADHPTGRFLFQYGVRRLIDLLGLFPADGYGGEGSTYTSHVNTPLAFWICEFFRQILDADCLDFPFPPNGTTLHSLLDMERKMISPGGLMPPWDHYGWQKPVNASAFAYLAKATGQPQYLSFIPAMELWSTQGSLAWWIDDPLWTLLWWPEEFKDFNDEKLPQDRFGWFLPRTGAALDDCRLHSRLLQVWDACADGISGICRWQANPNHMMFEYEGEPVFQDGIHVSGSHPWSYTADQVFACLTAEARERYLRYVLGNDTATGSFQELMTLVSHGLLGAANAIVIDEEPWYWPGQRWVGTPEQYSRNGGLQVVTAEAADFYRPRYDVRSVKRTSVWSDAGFGVILDDLRAESEHTWRWQVHLRPDVELEENAVAVRLGNGRHVRLAWAGTPEVRLTPIEGFPGTEEKRCMRLDLIARGTAAEFTVVIAPAATSAEVRRTASGQVEVVVDGVRHETTIPVAGAMDVTSDIHELPDLEADYAPAPSLFEAALKQVAEPAVRDGNDTTAATRTSDSCLAAQDYCFALLECGSYGDTAKLVDVLNHPRWPARAAAAEVLSRLGVTAVLPELRRQLQAEHALPPELLYPQTEDKMQDPIAAEERGKRWRLKAALIRALGRLGDTEAVPLFEQILRDGHDFHAVFSVTAQALGRIGDAAAVDTLKLAMREQEQNTALRARLALEHLTG